MLSLRLLIAAAVASAAWAAAARADNAVWLSPDWSVRRVVDVTARPANQPGGEVGVCTFYHGGRARPDGADIRVAVQGRRIVNHRLIQAGPGDLVRVAFEADLAEQRYYVYYGNPKAEPPPAWEPQRGVLLEVRQWPGGPAENFGQLQAAWARGKVIGADFVSHVRFGYNPFGESDQPALYRYVGWFVPPTPGTYQIATSSDDGSWILIDGKEVVAWPGPHGAVGDARHAKPHSMTVSLHRLEYWNVNTSGPMMAVAAWQLPAALDAKEPPKFEAVPAEAFLPVYEATLVETEVKGERLVADFLPQHAGESWWPERYAVRMRFKNLTPSAGPRRTEQFAWDFGDGQTSAEADPLHVYLAPGDYAVTLKATRGPLAATFSTKVRVERNWWQQTDPKLDPIEKYAEEVARYDLKRLDLPNLLLALDLLTHREMAEPAAAAAHEIVFNRRGVDDAVLLDAGLNLGRTLRGLKRPEDALAAYREAEKRVEHRGRKGEAAVLIGQTLLDDLLRYDEAEKEFDRVLRTYATAGAERVIRRAHVGLGDVARHRGDGAKARAAYMAAAAIAVAARSPNEAAVRVGTLARYVEEYTRQKDWEWAFQFLDEWAWDFPLDKLQGNWSLLKGQALILKGDRDAALREASDVVLANPQSPYAVRLLMLAAECHLARGETDKARLLLQTAVEDYPEDPARDEARKRLDALGGAVKAP